MHSVYGLCDPRTGDIKYIGQAVDVYKRYAQHLVYEECNPEKRAWINELKAIDKLPVLIVLEKGIATQDISRREMYWIEYHLERGFSLLNIVIPGRAPNGRGPRGAPAKKSAVKKTEVAVPSPAIIVDRTVVDDPDRMYELSEVAALFQVAESSIRRHILNGDMPATQGPYDKLIKGSDINAFVANQYKKYDKPPEQRQRSAS